MREVRLYVDKNESIFRPTFQRLKEKYNPEVQFREEREKFEKTAQEMPESVKAFMSPQEHEYTPLRAACVAIAEVFLETQKRGSFKDLEDANRVLLLSVLTGSARWECQPSTLSKDIRDWAQADTDPLWPSIFLLVVKKLGGWKKWFNLLNVCWEEVRGVEDAVVGEKSAEKPLPKNSTVEKRIERQTWLARAMLLVRDHPEWSDTNIAKEVKKSPSTLSRSKEYQMAAGLARGSAKANRPRGFKTADSNSGLNGIEAIAPSGEVMEDRSDRGQKIPGSRYWREYCRECSEPMMVPKDQVGINPICKHCE